MKTREQIYENWMKNKPLVVKKLSNMLEDEAREYLIEWGVTRKQAQDYIIDRTVYIEDMILVPETTFK